MNFERNITEGEINPMRAGINVENREEGDLIRAGLEDPAVRALVKVMGALSVLPSERSKRRVLTHVADYFEEQAELGESPMTL